MDGGAWRWLKCFSSDCSATRTSPSGGQRRCQRVRAALGNGGCPQVAHFAISPRRGLVSRPRSGTWLLQPQEKPGTRAGCPHGAAGTAGPSPWLSPAWQPGCTQGWSGSQPHSARLISKRRKRAELAPLHEEEPPMLPREQGDWRCQGGWAASGRGGVGEIWNSVSWASTPRTSVCAAAQGLVQR